MEKTVASCYMHDDTVADFMKLLAVTTQEQNSTLDAVARAATVLTATLQQNKQQNWRGIHPEADGMSLGREDVCQFFEAVIAGVDERIAALTRVLEAPEDDPAETAAAHEALLRSKAYPQLDDDDPPSSWPADSPERLEKQVQMCALKLYRALLNGGELDDTWSSTATSADTFNKEEARIELHAQKIYRTKVLGTDLPTLMEDEFHKLLDMLKYVNGLSEDKADIGFIMDATKYVTVQDVQLEDPSSLLLEPVEMDLRTNDFRRKKIFLRLLKSTFSTKIEKFISLFWIRYYDNIDTYLESESLRRDSGWPATSPEPRKSCGERPKGRQMSNRGERNPFSG